MSLSSISFMGIYFPILLLVYYNPIFTSRKFRNVILLLASLGLYDVAEPVYIVLLILSILLNYSLVNIGYVTKKKYWGYFAITVDVLLLLFFKYINQITGNFLTNNNVFMSISLPVGISYFTFREISYVVESLNDIKYRSVGFIETALYVSNFMTISAGPLGYYDSEIIQFQERETDKGLICAGFYRYSIGLAKKIIIADSLKNLVDVCFAQSDLSVFLGWGGAIAYTLEIYFDFSGYSDMAIGIGNVFGFELEENFDNPYMATSVSVFWKRWHMSLTKWFTRYVYIPLGGSRVDSKLRHIFNLWIVWMCTGIWHGSNWTFILWGMVYFIVQTLEKYTNFTKMVNRMHMGRIYTMFVVTICWVIFRAESLTAALRYIGGMIGIYSSVWINTGDLNTLKYYIIPMILGILLTSSLSNKIVCRICGKLSGFTVISYIVSFFAFLVAVVILIGKGYTAPLYAGF